MRDGDRFQRHRLIGLGIVETAQRLILVGCELHHVVDPSSVFHHVYAAAAAAAGAGVAAALRAAATATRWFATIRLARSRSLTVTTTMPTHNTISA